MESLERIFEPYRHADPSGWVGVYRQLPLWAGGALAAVGLIMLLFGGRRLFRVLAGPIGALIAMIWAETLAVRLGFESSSKAIATYSPLVLLALGLLLPPLVMFLSFGVPLGLLVGQLAGKADWMLGFAPGLIVGGAIGLALHRVVGVILSSAAGAWMFVIGLMAGLSKFTSSVIWLADHPVPTISLAGVVALGGIVFQLFIRATPEESERKKVDRAQAQRRAKENAQLEKRWSKYGKKA